jgi:hypothetical protein
MQYYSLIKPTRQISSIQQCSQALPRGASAATGKKLSCHSAGAGAGVALEPGAEGRLIGEAELGVTFAYKVGLDLLLMRHFSVGFRWNGMGNVAAYESVPVAWDPNGNVTRYEQRPTQSDEFSLGFFTLIAGFRF